MGIVFILRCFGVVGIHSVCSRLGLSDQSKECFPANENEMRAVEDGIDGHERLIPSLFRAPLQVRMITDDSRLRVSY